MIFSSYLEKNITLVSSRGRYHIF